ncbi:hypothetical protein DRH14_04970, partial [Candidatus Shapirobacteria bacterium]
DKVYIASFILEDNKITFYIDNNYTDVTIWADKLIVPNSIKWEGLKEVSTLYTTHSKKRIEVSASYDSANDVIIVVPAKKGGKIPIEPAIGSNTLVIQLNPSIPLVTRALVGAIMGAGVLLMMIGAFFSATPTKPEDWVKLIVLFAIVMSLIGIALSYLA